MCSNCSVVGDLQGLFGWFAFPSFLVHCAPVSCLAEPTLAVAASEAGSVYEALWFCHPGRERFQMAASVPPCSSHICYILLAVPLPSSVVWMA